MEATYLQDLEQSTEIVLEGGRRVQPSSEREPAAHVRRVAPGSAGRAAAAALELGGRMGAAITQRALAPAEARSLALIGVLMLVVTALSFLAPRLVSIPVGLFLGWIGIALLARSRRLRRQQRRIEASPGLR